MTPLIKKLVNGEITGYDLHLAALRGEVHHAQEHLDSAKAKAEHNAAVATGSCAPINKLIPVEANEGKDALRAFLHKVPKEGEADTPERVKKLLRKACKEGDPEANNPAQGVSALMLGGARQRGGCRAAAARAQGGHRRAHAQGRHRAVDRGGGRLRGARDHPPQRGRRPEHRRRGRRRLAGRVVAADGLLVQRHLETCRRMMIELGADINYGDENGWTALIWAASNGHAEVIEMLNDYEAEIEFADVNGWTGLRGRASTPTTRRSRRSSSTCGAKPSPIAADGRTPLMFLASTGATSACSCSCR